MTYAERIATIAKEIGAEADRLVSLEKSRSDWVAPEREWLAIGPSKHYIVGKSGKVTAGLEGVQREMLKIHDAQIAQSKGRIEGLRFKLVQVAKQGGAA